jgi:hypothetical protein
MMLPRTPAGRRAGSPFPGRRPGEMSGQEPEQASPQARCLDPYVGAPRGFEPQPPDPSSATTRPRLSSPSLRVPVGPGKRPCRRPESGICPYQSRAAWCGDCDARCPQDVSARRGSCTSWVGMEPSPPAEATRLIDRWRTSPAATRLGGRFQPAGKAARRPLAVPQQVATGEDQPVLARSSRSCMATDACDHLRCTCRGARPGPRRLWMLLDGACWWVRSGVGRRAPWPR